VILQYYKTDGSKKKTKIIWKGLTHVIKLDKIGPFVQGIPPRRNNSWVERNLVVTRKWLNPLWLIFAESLLFGCVKGSQKGSFSMNSRSLLRTAVIYHCCVTSWKHEIGKKSNFVPVFFNLREWLSTEVKFGFKKDKIINFDTMDYLVCIVTTETPFF